MTRIRHPASALIGAILLLAAAPTLAQTTPAPVTPSAPPVTTPTTPPALAPTTPPPAASTPAPDAEAQEVMLEARPAILIRGDATWEDGFTTLTKAFAALQDAATRAGLKVAGKPLAYFVQTDDQGFRYEAMLPLLEAAAAGAPVSPAQSGMTPAGRTLRFPNTGPYDDIDSVYEAITAYVEDKGLTAKGTFLEEYVSIPSTSEDPNLQLNIYVFLQ